MEDTNIPVFAQAKIEYTKQLIDILYSHIFDGIKSIYDESKVIFSKKTTIPILLIFRELLEKVPIWNNEIIDSECSRIMEVSGCDWIEDLITAVFISHTKILTSIGFNNNASSINVTIPKTTTFIHKIYINIARELWKNPYLFNENVPGHEYQRNSKEIENIIKLCIESTIRNLLPIKEILREHLDTYDNTENLSSKDIKQLLKEELKELKMSIKDNEKNNQAIDNQYQDDELKNEETKDEKTKDIDNAADNIENTKTLISLIKDNDTINEPEENIVNELKNEIEKTSNNTAPKQNNIELFTSDGDPTQAQVEKQCNDIVVNDITIPVDIPDELSNNSINNSNDVNVKTSEKIPTEVKYDNVDLFVDNKSKNNDKFNNLLTNNVFNIVKNDNIKNNTSDIKPEIKPEIKSEIKAEIKPEPIKLTSPVSDNLNLFKGGLTSINENKEVKDSVVMKSGPVPVPEPEPEPEPKREIEISETNKKEVVNITNDNDIDETSSLANFFSDIKNIAEEKGIKVEKSNNFVLFDDAPFVDPNTNVIMS